MAHITQSKLWWRSVKMLLPEWRTSLAWIVYTGKNQSCDVKTKILGLPSTQVPFVEVVVMVPRQMSWLKTSFSGKVIKTIHLLLYLKTDWCTTWRCAVFSLSLQSWLKRGCLLVVIWQLSLPSMQDRSWAQLRARPADRPQSEQIWHSPVMGGRPPGLRQFGKGGTPSQTSHATRRTVWADS